MTLKINNYDFTPYISKGGYKWQRNDVEAADAGRTLDGKMHRGRVATKIRLDITLIPLDSTTAATLLTYIQNETVTVDYTDPQAGERTGVEMYSNNNPALYCMAKGNTDYWTGMTFPLIEV